MSRRLSPARILVVATIIALAGCSADKGSSTAGPGVSGASISSAATPSPNAAGQSSARGASTVTATNARDLPALFPDDFPFPTDLAINETRDDTATALLGGTMASSVDSLIEFYDSRLPALGWEFDDITSSGGAHVFTRDNLRTSIVGAVLPTDPGVTTFQISLENTG